MFILMFIWIFIQMFIWIFKKRLIYRVFKKNGAVFILQMSRQPSIRFSNRFFLLKTEIHTQILNTKPFLCDFWGSRYLPNKIEFLTRAIVINSFLCNFHLSGVLKDDKNEQKYEQIYPVGTTFVISGYLRGCRCQSGVS